MIHAGAFRMVSCFIGFICLNQTLDTGWLRLIPDYSLVTLGFRRWMHSSTGRCNIGDACVNGTQLCGIFTFRLIQDTWYHQFSWYTWMADMFWLRVCNVVGNVPHCAVVGPCQMIRDSGSGSGFSNGFQHREVGQWSGQLLHNGVVISFWNDNQISEHSALSLLTGTRRMSLWTGLSTSFRVPASVL